LDLCNKIHAAYDQILKHFTTLLNKGKEDLFGDSYSKVLSKEITEFISSLSTHGSSGAQDQIGMINYETRHLRSKLSVLQEKRSGWDFSLCLAQNEL
jgi:hypothetical protein